MIKMLMIMMITTTIIIGLEQAECRHHHHHHTEQWIVLIKLRECEKVVGERMISYLIVVG